MDCQHHPPLGGYEWLASHSLASKNPLANTNFLQGWSGTGVAQAAILTQVHSFLSIHKLMFAELPPSFGCFV